MCTTICTTLLFSLNVMTCSSSDFWKDFFPQIWGTFFLWGGGGGIFFFFRFLRYDCPHLQANELLRKSPQVYIFHHLSNFKQVLILTVPLKFFYCIIKCASCYIPTTSSGLSTTCGTWISKL